MNTFEELYFTIKFRCKYEIEGLIRYKNIGNVEKDGDIIDEFIKLNLFNEEVIEVMRENKLLIM